MPFSDFHGNGGAIGRVRQMLAHDRFPHAVILAGPAGSGKFMLAQMVARAMNCLQPPPGDLPDFCGACANCLRIGDADDLEARIAEALEAREALRDADKRETRIFVQTHPDVLIVPPDPPQNLIKVDQVRHVIATIHYRPATARQRVFLFTDSAFMKEAANALLKVLEEPPEFATLWILTENPGELLPTIRSRCITLRLAPLPFEEIEALLRDRRSGLNAEQRRLVARLSGGAAGRALGFDLARYAAARADALTVLNSAVGGNDHSALFKVTDTYRAGADGRQKTENLISAAYGLLQDLLHLKWAGDQMVRNIDLLPQLRSMAQSVEFDWLVRASDGLAEVERGMRRNLLRSLALDAFAAGLER
ncbi:MAG: DNA polymerase III subunit delta' [Acidobacteria bacterium]|nr:DNA polymerase III subunit delta' [Acidobacteriota bacterium]